VILLTKTRKVLRLKGSAWKIKRKKREETKCPKCSKGILRVVDGKSQCYDCGYTQDVPTLSSFGE